MQLYLNILHILICVCVFLLQICGMVFTCCLHRRIKLDPYWPISRSSMGHLNCLLPVHTLVYSFLLFYFQTAWVCFPPSIVLHKCASPSFNLLLIYSLNSFIYHWIYFPQSCHCTVIWESQQECNVVICWYPNNTRGFS